MISQSPGYIGTTAKASTTPTSLRNDGAQSGPDMLRFTLHYYSVSTGALGDNFHEKTAQPELPTHLLFIDIFGNFLALFN